MQPDPDKVFDTRVEAQAARDRLNQQPPELGWSPWYLGGPVEGKWWVVRARGVMAEDLDVAPQVYDERFRDAVRRSAEHHDVWRDGDGIEFDDVSLDGSYPDTRLVLVFRAVESRKIRFGRPTADCRFGTRTRIWPAEYTDPGQEAYFHDIYFMEFLGTNPRAYIVRGARPCDPSTINWLD